MGAITGVVFFTTCEIAAVVVERFFAETVDVGIILAEVETDFRGVLLATVLCNTGGAAGREVGCVTLKSAKTPSTALASACMIIENRDMLKVYSEMMYHWFQAGLVYR